MRLGAYRKNAIVHLGLYSAADSDHDEDVMWPSIMWKLEFASVRQVVYLAAHI